MEKYTYQEIFENEETNWWFVGTRNIIFAQIQKIFGDKDNLKILDIGCGTGIVMKKLEKYGEVYGMDISEEAIKFCNKRGIKNISKSSALKIPYKNDYFDLITILDVLEHVDEDQKTLEEINRVLKREGICILTVPAFSFIWSEHDIALHHKRRYNLKFLSLNIKKAGMKLEKASYYNFFLSPLIMMFRIMKNFLKNLFHKNYNEASAKTDLFRVNSFTNMFLKTILNIEASFLKKVWFPFGISILAIIKKQKPFR
jgi:ubiquinone/menaquinone biosynthesis C-methylase UbiE